MSDRQLHDIEVRADAATPGLHADAREDGTWYLWVDAGGSRVVVADGIRYREDALFLCEGPAHVRLLVGEVRRLRKLVRRAVEHLRQHDDRGPLGEGWQSDELLALIEEAEAV